MTNAICYFYVHQTKPSPQVGDCFEVVKIMPGTSWDISCGGRWVVKAIIKPVPKPAAKCQVPEQEVCTDEKTASTRNGIIRAIVRDELENLRAVPVDNFAPHWLEALRFVKRAQRELTVLPAPDAEPHCLMQLLIALLNSE